MCYTLHFSNERETMKRFLLLFLCLIMNCNITANDYKYRNNYSYKVIKNSRKASKKFERNFINFLEHYNGNYQRALLDAASFGYNEFIKPLLSLGAKINGYDYDDGRKTALVYAAEYGHASTCELLLKFGAYIEVRTSGGFTPLMWAAEYGHTEVCRLLLDHGAQVNARNDYGNAAAYYAHYYGHNELGYFLNNYGYSPYHKNDDYAAAALISLSLGLGCAYLLS